jgi:tetratricopeptide (TPR) repeat protein
LHRYRRAITPEQYLAQLHDPNLLDHPSLQGRGISPTGHIQHIGRTFALSYDQLDATDAVDAQSLALLACLALMAPGEPAPYALPAETFGLDLTDARQAAMLEDSIVRLAELGLIDVQDNRQLRIHRLLAAFVRAADAALCARVQAELEQVIQRKLDENYLDANYQMNSALNLLPIQAHVRQVVENALAREDAQSATLSHALARYWWQLGSFAEAEHYATRGLAIRQALYGKSHDGAHDGSHADIAVSHHLLGILCQRSNSFEQAHQHFQTALEIQVQLAGENHFNTADILVNMAELHWAQQQIPEAIACLERGLAICDEAVEEDHPLVAQLTMTLALCLHNGQRDPQQARYYMEEALRIRRHTFGEAHPYTAMVYMNMGYLLRETGQLDEADDYYRRGLAIRQQTLGEKHVETAHALFSLGKLRRIQEHLDEAQQCMEQALAILLVDQGEMYSLVASCRHELGAILLSRGDPARARRYFEEALAAHQAIYRDDHPYVVSTRQALQQAIEAEQRANGNEENAGG